MRKSLKIDLNQTTLDPTDNQGGSHQYISICVERRQVVTDEERVSHGAPVTGQQHQVCRTDSSRVLMELTETG